MSKNYSQDFYDELFKEENNDMKPAGKAIIIVILVLICLSILFVNGRKINLKFSLQNTYHEILKIKEFDFKPESKEFMDKLYDMIEFLKNNKQIQTIEVKEGNSLYSMEDTQENYFAFF